MPDLADTAEAKGFAAVLRAMETASTTADARLIAVAAIINGGRSTIALIGHDGENFARITRLLAAKAIAEIRAARERAQRDNPTHTTTSREALLHRVQVVLEIASDDLDNLLADIEAAGDG